MKRSTIAAIAILVEGGAATYQYLVRPWCVHWGTRPDEVRAPLPGDDIVPEPAGSTTRAITIAAPPTAVWPWLAQLGQGRGGAYTYDWIENLLGLGMHSADQILPQFQHPVVGDVVLRTPGSTMVIASLEVDRFLVAASPDQMWSWAFLLTPLATGSTRLLSRNRWQQGGIGVRLGMLLMEPASLVMERKMLLGIKQRVERAPAMVETRADTDRGKRDTTGQGESKHGSFGDNGSDVTRRVRT